MFWTIYLGFIIFLLGLILGSFYNVCIYRIPEELSIISPPSHCGSCNHTLAPLDLIPVLSWCLLGRKCRYCKAPISYRYPLIEALTGLLFVLLFIKFQLSWDLLFYMVFVSILIIITFIDIDHRIIPDRFIVMGLVVGVASLATPILILISKDAFSNIETSKIPSIILSLLPWKNALIGGSIGGGSLLVIDIAGRIFFKKEGMGFGDVKLMFMAGIFLGAQQTVIALLIAVWTAAIAGIVIIRIRKGNDDHYMPFGPFLAIGCVFSIFLGNTLVNWYLSFI